MKNRDHYHSGMACVIARLKCNKDRAIIRSEVQECQNELMRIKSRLTVFDYGIYLDTAIRLWDEAYEFNQRALGKTTMELIEEAG